MVKRSEKGGIKTIFDNKGSSLLEVVVALALLAISMITILALFQFSMTSNVDSLRKTAATQMARRGMEDVRAQTVAIGTYSEIITFDNINYKVYREIMQSPIYPDIYEVGVKVYWPDTRGQERLVEIQMERTPD
ncbi:type IV pilus modification PilV family protein [Phosphitispora sp. TUW77]|uniref:type IV pilus modification PilV family protein n=1 Tax=Phosphitispora sp. TUW77 TaxID=3152361 RepID=UPI003AB67E0D